MGVYHEWSPYVKSQEHSMARPPVTVITVIWTHESTDTSVSHVSHHHTHTFIRHAGGFPAQHVGSIPRLLHVVNIHNLGMIKGPRRVTREILNSEISAM
jgi:hypothetical protein